ncbi:MAG TPA: hypothetical protein VGM11_01985, partial [Acidobacteriaceae bacterium]
MELIERYLQAIGQYLPADTRNDILAELRSELEEQVDARAAEWGRPLDEADVAALLKAHGRPSVIALRYLPQRSLIGPTVFPFYEWTLRRGLPVVLLLAALANGLVFAVSPHQGPLAPRIADAIFGLVPTLFIFWGVVTILFAAVDWARTKPLGRAHTDRWDPLKLPALKAQPARQRSFYFRLFELAAHLLWMTYVLLIPTHPFLMIGPGAAAMRSAGVGLAPVWHPFFNLLILMLCVQLVMRIVALWPGEQALVKPLDVLANIIGIAGVSLLASARQTLV